MPLGRCLPQKGLPESGLLQAVNKGSMWRSTCVCIAARFTPFDHSSMAQELWALHDALVRLGCRRLGGQRGKHLCHEREMQGKPVRQPVARTT